MKAILRSIANNVVLPPIKLVLLLLWVWPMIWLVFAGKGDLAGGVAEEIIEFTI